MKNSIKTGLFIAVLLAGINTSYSQITAKNAAFLEVMGNAGTLSLNYDRILAQGKWLALTANAGAGYFTVYAHGVPSYNKPADYGYYGAVSLLIGKKKHYAEIGAGVSYNCGGFSYSAMDNGTLYGNPGVYMVPRIGYRFQKDEGGLFLRAGFTPFLLLQSYSDGNLQRIDPYYTTSFFNGMAGVSVGYSFGHKKQTE